MPQAYLQAARLSAQDGLNAACAALAETAKQANAFVVGRPREQEPIEGSFFYRHDLPLVVPRRLQATPSENKGMPLQTEDVFFAIGNLSEEQHKFNRLKANLEEYEKAFEQHRSKNPLKRFARGLFLADAESQQSRPATELIADTKQALVRSFRYLETLKKDERFKEDAEDAANRGNALSKVDGFIKLQQRLQIIFAQVDEDLGLPRLSLEQKSNPQGLEISEELRSDSAVSIFDRQPSDDQPNDLQLSPPVREALDQWFADVAKYQAFLAALQEKYGGNKLTRKQLIFDEFSF